MQKEVSQSAQVHESPKSEARSQAAKISTSTIEKRYKYQAGPIYFEISSIGMGLRSFKRTDFRDRHGGEVVQGQVPDTGLFELRTKEGQPVEFDSIEQPAPEEWIGYASIGDVRIKRKIKFLRDYGYFESKISFISGTVPSIGGFGIVVGEGIFEPSTSSWLFPNYEIQEFFVQHSGTKESFAFTGLREDFLKNLDNVSLVSVGTHYFANAIRDLSSVPPSVELRASPRSKVAIATLFYDVSTYVGDLEFKQLFYAGPKSVDYVKPIGDGSLTAIVHFGFFDFLAKPLLYVMKWSHSLLSNWGLAIIALTLLVRLLVLPLHLSSIRSMKAMQKIQPQLQLIRERYKDDPVAMNRETMALMRESKANPLGGCLPMLLQIPIFFALYKVIGSAVELYQAPFFAWIKDLSTHDPYYVLPILMGVAMYFQSKMTPTTLDPVQAKIFAFLPVIFTVFMLQLPSGLTLYMLVSALFTIVQQYVLLRKEDLKEARQEAK
ncbi:MAG: membrane protein insertase YidC [Bdellovibrionaceae bacterium]|nr:membrane protein insertase YidC [Pseudobdellovibrionaceae bacterium]